MFQSIDISTKALDAALLRFNAITSNIANADTPGYKRQDVDFEQALIKEIERNGGDNIKIENLTPSTYTDQTHLSYRLDGNNVDVDTEMAKLSQVKLRYDTLIQRTNAQIGRYKYILSNIK